MRSELARSDALVRNFHLARRALAFEPQSSRVATLGTSVALYFEKYFNKFVSAATALPGIQPGAYVSPSE